MTYTQLKKYRIRTAFSILSAGILLLNQVLVPAAVFAQEASSSAEEAIITPVPDTPTPTPSPSVEGESDSSLTTGDAQSAATTDQTVNENIIDASGGVQATDCALTGNICPINIENTAETDTNSTSSATTGQNTADGFDTSTITTGDAGAYAGESALINGTVISTDGTLEEAQSPPQDSTIVLDNEATASSTTTSDATSGSNTINAEDEGTIITGDSIAASNQVNLVNTNLIGSSVDFFEYAIFDDSASLDINALWKALQEQAELSDGTLNTQDPIYILITNNANLNLTASSQAISGDNAVTADTATIDTGNAYASTSVFNLINVNILGSTIMLGVINIFGVFEGDIILPNMDRFFEESLFQSSIRDFGQGYVFSKMNKVELTSLVDASADSGTNTQTGDDLSLQTGDAFAYGMNRSLMNTNLSLQDIFVLFLNNFGLWQGSVLGWTAPDSTDNQETAAAEYSTTDMAALSAEGEVRALETGAIDNTTMLNARLSAKALSGQNTTEGIRSRMTTGTAIAAAHLINILNTTLIGNKLLIPIINIFGSWKGNLIFAYPDLAVSINADKEEVSLGESIAYTVRYVNIGYEDARSPSIDISLPQGESLSSSSLPTTAAGDQLSFHLGVVKPKQSGSFTFTTSVVAAPSSDQAASHTLIGTLKELFVRPVHAEGDLQPMMTTAHIVSLDNDSNTQNNSASFVKYYNPHKGNFNPTVVEESIEEESTSPIGYVELTADSYNNINNFVYSGDTVLYTAKISNGGTATAHNVSMKQIILNERGLIVVENPFSLSSINPGSTKTLVFQLRIPPAAPAGKYTSVITVKTSQPDGTDVFSNDSVTSIQVRSHNLTLAKPVQAADMPSQKAPAVLGKATQQAQSRRTYWPFILALAVSSLWAAEVYRRNRIEEVEE